MKRFFCEKIENDITLRNDEHRHLAFVLRLKPKDKVILFDGSGFDYICQIKRIEKNETHLFLVEKIKSECEPKNEYILFVATLKGDKKNYVVQKSVELGVSRIEFFSSQYSIADVNIERLQKISIEACKQCGRSIIVPIKYAGPILKIDFSKYENTIFFYEKSNNKFIDIKKHKQTAIIIGPEGGFSEEEYNKLKIYDTISFGKRILRADTSAIVGLSICMFHNGEFF